MRGVAPALLGVRACLRLSVHAWSSSSMTLAGSGSMPTCGGRAAQRESQRRGAPRERLPRRAGAPRCASRPRGARAAMQPPRRSGTAARRRSGAARAGARAAALRGGKGVAGAPAASLCRTQPHHGPWQRCRPARGAPALRRLRRASAQRGGRRWALLFCGAKRGERHSPRLAAPRRSPHLCARRRSATRRRAALRRRGGHACAKTVPASAPTQAARARGADATHAPLATRDTLLERSGRDCAPRTTSKIAVAKQSRARSSQRAAGCSLACVCEPPAASRRRAVCAAERGRLVGGGLQPAAASGCAARRVVAAVPAGSRGARGARVRGARAALWRSHCSLLLPELLATRPRARPRKISFISLRTDHPRGDKTKQAYVRGQRRLPRAAARRTLPRLPRPALPHARAATSALSSTPRAWPPPRCACRAHSHSRWPRRRVARLR